MIVQPNLSVVDNNRYKTREGMINQWMQSWRMYLEYFVDVWRNDSRRISGGHTRKLFGEIADIELIDNARDERRRHRLFGHLLPVQWL